VIEVKVIKDSVGPNGIRLTTVCMTYPRFAHAEVMTHRVFSRNASSSRAIPVKKQVQMVRDNPAIPLAFTRNKPGMQGGEALDDESHKLALKYWLAGRDHACDVAEELISLEVHKQYANRVLEPWAHISVIVTSTDWDNFWALRWHKDALPEMQVLAQKHYEALQMSVPEQLKAGEWHLPYVEDKDIYEASAYIADGLVEGDLDQVVLKQSVARCARVSYLNHDGTPTELVVDLGLADRLTTSQPLHASPAEHQAMAVGDPEVRSGNFRGWIQYRKTIPGECVKSFTPPT
jgi:thymidylate synthase ThyX